VQISSSDNGAYEQQCTEAAAAEKTKAWHKAAWHNKQLQSSTKRQLAKENGKK